MIDAIRDYINKGHLTHAGAFFAGAIVAFGLFSIDSNVGNVSYSASESNVAAVSQQITFHELGDEFATSTVSDTLNDEEVVDEENTNEDDTEQENREETEEAAAAVEEPETTTEVTEETTDDQTQQEEEEIAAALAAAQETLSQLQEQQNSTEQSTSASNTTVVEDCFETPNGKKINSSGNELNEDCTPKTSTTSSTNQTQETQVNDNGTVTKIADGYYQLPTGKWTDANGNIYDEPPMITQVSSQQAVQDDIVTLGSGVVINRRTGVIISRPEEKEVEEDLTPPTVIGDNPPEVGSTINIPKYIASRVYLNPSITCEQFNYHNNDLALCKLYRNNKDDYTWVEVKTQ